MRKVEKVIVICENCGIGFPVHPYRVGKARFCNRKCVGSYAYAHNESIKAAFSRDRHGSNHPMFGKHLSEEHRRKISLNHADMSGANNPTWKGDDVGYHGLHDWIEKEKGKPSKCEVCGTTSATKYHWANKGHTYKRLADDWIRVCVSCHKHLDGHFGPAWGELMKRTRWAV